LQVETAGHPVADGFEIFEVAEAFGATACRWNKKMPGIMETRFAAFNPAWLSW
jgi:hypothetical protein